MTNKEFASNLRMMRALYRWSQQDLAKKFRVTATYISLLETGKCTPSWGFVKKFARATGQEIRIEMKCRGCRRGPVIRKT